MRGMISPRPGWFCHRGQNHPFIVSYRRAHDAHRVSCSVRLPILAQEYVIDV